MTTESDIDDKSFAIPGSESIYQNYSIEKPRLKLGFPNMKYLDPELVGPPIEVHQTFYKNFEA